MRILLLSIVPLAIAAGPSRMRRFPLGAQPEPLAREPKVGKPVKGAKKVPPPAPCTNPKREF